MARAELLEVSDAPAEGIEVALEPVRDEMEAITALYREWVWALELDADREQVPFCRNQ